MEHLDPGQAKGLLVLIFVAVLFVILWFTPDSPGDKD
jgi:hypothetical protein